MNPSTQHYRDTRSLADILQDLGARHGDPEEQYSRDEQLENRRRLAAQRGAVAALCGRRYGARQAAELEARFGLHPTQEMATEIEAGVTYYRIDPAAFRNLD